MDMIKLENAMRKTEGWKYCWWMDKQTNDIINRAKKLGYIHRCSTTQVHWTLDGINELNRYKNEVKLFPCIYTTRYICPKEFRTENDCDTCYLYNKEI